MRRDKADWRPATSKVVAFLIFLACVGTATVVIAGDVKLMPGSSCNSTADQVLYWRHYVYNNNSSYNRTVSCPLVRDDETDDEWDGNLAVNVHDHTSSGEVCCTGYIGDWDSTSACFSAGSTDCSGASHTGYTALILNAPSCSYGASSTWVVQCSIPDRDGSSRSYVYGYNWEE